MNAIGMSHGKMLGCLSRWIRASIATVTELNSVVIQNRGITIRRGNGTLTELADVTFDKISTVGVPVLHPMQWIMLMVKDEALDAACLILKAVVALNCALGLTTGTKAQKIISTVMFKNEVFEFREMSLEVI